MTALYVPGTEETDPKKQNQSLQLIGGQTSTNTDNIATNTASIATLTTNGATYVAGPGSATANGFAVYSGTTGKLVKDHAATIDLTAEVSGVLPVANGGTADSGTAWTTYTPTITSTAGTFTTTSSSGRWKQIGKTVFISVAVTITTVGSATGFILATLPVNNNASTTAHLVGREAAVGGKTFIGKIASNQAELIFYDNTATSTVAGGVFQFSGVYEAA